MLEGVKSSHYLARSSLPILQAGLRSDLSVSCSVHPHLKRKSLPRWEVIHCIFGKCGQLSSGGNLLGGWERGGMIRWEGGEADSRAASADGVSHYADKERIQLPSVAEPPQSPHAQTEECRRENL